MKSKIQKICVIGAGVMGSGIAAQIANSRTKVLILDISSKDASDVNSIANKAVEKMLISKPDPLSHPDMVNYIETGNLDDDLEKIRDCDLIIEAIVERIDIKKNLYSKIASFIAEDALIASNTSTLPLSVLKNALPESLRNKFLIMHFFNPPRYMELLELVYDTDLPSMQLEAVKYFIEHNIGKTIVECNDTPGFIANRVGCFLLEMVVRRAIDRRLNFVKIDRIFNKLLHFPNTAIFGLYDLIGHDVMKLISASLISALPDNDAYHNIYIEIKALDNIAQKGFIGKKSGSGFYKIEKDGNKKISKMLNIENLEYIEIDDFQIPENIDQLINSQDPYGQFFKDVIEDFYSYLISLIPEVTSNAEDIEIAMKLGYSLKYGPFELIEKIVSTNPFISSLIQKYKGPYLKSNPSKITLASNTKILEENNSVVVYENSENYQVIFKTKAGTLNPDIFNAIIDIVNFADPKKKIILSSNSNIFSAGADLRIFKDNIRTQNLQAIAEFLDLGQKAMMSLKYSNSPIISCAKGGAFGGGMEILLHSHHVVAHQNLKSGLVEVGVGLIPGWGGTKEMFLRSGGDQNKLVSLLKNIILKRNISSAEYLVTDFYICSHTNMNTEFMYDEANNLHIEKINNKSSINLPEFDIMESFQGIPLDRTQVFVLEFMQSIIKKGAVTEAELLHLEQEMFLKLCTNSDILQKLEKF